MRTARSQTNDLGRTEQFFGALLSGEEIKEVEKSIPVEPVKPVQVNGGSVSFKVDAKPRFSDPPAPPPQQPLPEKPDTNRSHLFDPSSPSLKRTNTERPRSVPNVSSNGKETSSQIGSLVEALSQAKKEIDAQSARMRDLEEMLKKEREARETAESHAKRLQMESASAKLEVATPAPEERVLDEAFEPPTVAVGEVIAASKEISPSTEAVEASTSKLQEKLELMIVEMKEMKEHMEAYRSRAETAESERDVDRKTLAEMVEKYRSEEQARRESSRRGRSRSRSMKSSSATSSDDASVKPTNGFASKESSNGKAIAPPELAGLEKSLAVALSRPPGSQDHLLYQSGPYASMLGVVLLGMGLMAYMNGWQKVER